MATVRTKSMGGTIGRVDLTPAEYLRLIEQKGYRATWEKATVCPFRSPNNLLVHDMNHTCDQGFVYYDPQPVRVLITGLSMNRQYMQTGKWDVGSAIVTLGPDKRISFQDKLTLSDSTTRFYELVTRQPVGVVDTPKYPIVTVLDIRDSMRTYVEGVDFTINSGGSIVWKTGGQKPDDETLYSVSYNHRVVYLIIDMAHDIRDSMLMPTNASFPKLGTDLYAQMPVQGVARMHFLVRDQSMEAASP
jgi:hypothetical protein